MRIKQLIISALSLLICSYSMGETIEWKGKTWRGIIDSSGCLKHIVFTHGSQNDTVPFFTNTSNAGPSFYVESSGKRVVGQWKPDGYLSYRSEIDNVECRITYSQSNAHPSLKVTLTNIGNVPFQPTKAGLRMGIDTYMDKYPNWFGKYFPTLMRNERTHFYGYMQTPGGQILGIVSPDAIASWSVDYNLGYQDPAPHWFMGHRIESLNLDLMNALPLPEHNPQNLWCLPQGKSLSWTIILTPISSLNQLEEQIHKVAPIPLIKLPQTTYVAGETATFKVLASEKASILISDSQQKTVANEAKYSGKGVWQVSCQLPQIGLYTIDVADGTYQAEGILSAHASWRWTLEQARNNALRYHQKPTSHAESWYGFYSAFIAAKQFPEADIDRQLSHRFDLLFNKLHTDSPTKPRYYASRIQNTACTIGMLVDKYQAYGNETDLNKAAELADWIIDTWQRNDGAYMNHGTIYTSVIYVAKSILELTLVEQELGKKSATWADNARRHYDSAKRAIDQLVESQGNFQTEGEHTFEDGMIACSALQMGMLGLMQHDAKTRKHYCDAMLQILNSHDCLAQLCVPDARRRGGTMRFWEAQYDVQMLPNMFNSPHGWSGWRAYATYYAYLLTGDEHWLVQTVNASGAFSHLISYPEGTLHWAFVVDPYLQVEQACSADTHFTADSLSFGNPHPRLYDTRKFVIGEQYVNMISDWQTINTQDNDVHELFKFIGEAMLTNAFVVERADGTITGYNCKVQRKGNTLAVKPLEKQITNLHCNLKAAHTVTFLGNKRNLDAGFLGWAFGTDPYRQPD